MDHQKNSNVKIGVSGAGKNYLKMPWSIEDTIENLEELKEIMKQKLIDTNYQGIGEKDAEEVAFDFDRAIQALKENQEYKQLGTLEEVREAVEKQKWIPCSERSPENISTVIVQVKEIEKPTVGWYGNMDGWRLTERDFAELKDFTVIAWIPLTEPYRPNKCHGCFGAANNDCERCMDGQLLKIK